MEIMNQICTLKEFVAVLLQNTLKTRVEFNANRTFLSKYFVSYMRPVILTNRILQINPLLPKM